MENMILTNVDTDPVVLFHCLSSVKLRSCNLRINLKKPNYPFLLYFVLGIYFYISRDIKRIIALLQVRYKQK